MSDELYEFSSDVPEPVTFASVAAAVDGKPMTARGLGIVFGQLSEPRKLPNGQVVQWRFAAGSAKPTADVIIRYQHQPGAILGRTSNGTARIFEVEGGVQFEVDLPDTQLGRDTAYLLKRGDLKASSVGAKSARGRIGKVEGNLYPVFDVESFSYPEISIVDAPGFEGATAGLLADAVNVDVNQSAEPIPEPTEKSVEQKKDYRPQLMKIKLADLKRQSIARGLRDK
ncbi:MAG TPA: HK97 family phage prohead protease [Hymenobacter sp.]|jgi:phage head maturation protease